MKNCVFCGAPLVGKARAKEHVLRASWLRALDLTTARAPVTLLRALDVVEVRDHQAEQLQAGEICRTCNNGWMHCLDSSVSDDLLAMARGQLRPSHLGRDARLRLARWMLKTACVFESLQHAARRHIPAEMKRALMAGGFLPPDGFVMVAHQFPTEVQPRVGICLVDVWPTDENRARLQVLPQSDRLKFAVQYRRIVLSCVCISTVRMVGCETIFGAEVITSPVLIAQTAGAISEEDLIAAGLENHPSVFFAANLNPWLD